MDSGRKLHNQEINRAFVIGVTLNVGFVIVEAIFGFISNSLALLADAGHNLSDVLGLLLSWGAVYLSGRRATQRRTYGWRSSSIFAALINAVILLLAIGGILWEAPRRLHAPLPVYSKTIIWVASVGVVVNAITAWLFWEKGKKDLNIRSAFLHMAADAAISVGVVIAGVIILYSAWTWIDPILSIIIALVIMVGTWQLLRESVNLALHAVPQGIDVQSVSDYLKSLPGVSSVHDLHIWGMSTTETALTAHLVKTDTFGDDQLISRAATELQQRFGIAHTTLQIEHGEQLCENDIHCLPNHSS